MRKTKEEAREWGAFCEQVVMEHLVRNGFTIRERNWRPTHTHKEVDIIAQKDNIVVFVEVKGRSNPDYDPLDAIDSKKIRNLVRAADIYLRNAEFDYEFRFDIASVVGTTEKYELTYIEDAFLPPLGS